MIILQVKVLLFKEIGAQECPEVKQDHFYNESQDPECIQQKGWILIKWMRLRNYEEISNKFKFSGDGAI
jgi:hypothetical protein